MRRILYAGLLTFTLALPLAASAADAPGFFPIPGTDTTIKFYGYIQLDSTYDASGRIGDIENYDYGSLVGVQPLDGTPNAREKGKLYLTARTSRFGIQTATPSGLGIVGTKLEMDLYGANLVQGQTYTNSVLFRMRHAYGTVGNFLVGQNWTNFLDLASAPDTVDFNGPGSMALIRQPQLRYTLPIGSAASVALSLENSRNGGVGHLPDFVAKLATGGKWGSLGLGLVTNQYRYNKAGDSTPRSGVKQGYGAALSGSYKLGKDTLVAHVVGGEGLGRYLFNTVGTIGTGFVGLDSNGDVTLWRNLAYHVGFTHVWNGAFRSNVVWSQTMFYKNGIDLTGAPTEDDEGTAEFVPNERVDQGFVNTFWSFTKTAEVGLEYEYGRRKTFDGQTGKQDRVTATFHYNFF